jgi:hypothetical protein
MTARSRLRALEVKVKRLAFHAGREHFNANAKAHINQQKPLRRFSLDHLLALVPQEDDGAVRVHPMGRSPRATDRGHSILETDGSALFVSLYDAESGWICIEVPASRIPSALGGPSS